LKGIHLLDRHGLLPVAHPLLDSFALQGSKTHVLAEVVQRLLLVDDLGVRNSAHSLAPLVGLLVISIELELVEPRSQTFNFATHLVVILRTDRASANYLDLLWVQVFDGRDLLLVLTVCLPFSRLLLRSARRRSWEAENCTTPPPAAGFSELCRANSLLAAPAAAAAARAVPATAVKAS